MEDETVEEGVVDDVVNGENIDDLLTEDDVVVENEVLSNEVVNEPSTEVENNG